MFGQLGLNSDVDHIYPCQLKTLRSIKVKYIVCGEDFSVFLTQVCSKKHVYIQPMVKIPVL